MRRTGRVEAEGTMNRPDFTEIYREYQPRVMGYICARVCPRSDAEDLCSEVFEKVHLKLEGYDPSKASLSTWIYTITRNCVIDHFRRRRPSEELDESLSSDFQVDEALLREETLDELADALLALPRELREIIVRRYYDEMPLTDISRAMGLSYGATKLRHASALRQLRKAMEHN